MTKTIYGSLLGVMQVVALGAMGSVAAAPLPLRFVDPTVRIQPGPKSGLASLVIRCDAPSSEQRVTKDLPVFVDRALPLTLAAGVQTERVVEITPAADTGRTFRVDLLIDGLDGANTIQRRYAKISWLKQDWDLDYQLSNQPPTDYKWDVVGLPAEWNINRDRCAGFRLSQSTPAATGVSLSATLV